MVEGISKVDSVIYLGVSIALKKGEVIRQKKALITESVKKFTHWVKGCKRESWNMIFL